MVHPTWHAIKKIPKQYPLAFGVVISTVKTSASDLLVQKVVERKEQIDWKRNIAFGTFGFFYLGGFQYFLYVPVFGRLFPCASKFAAKPLREKVKDIRGMMSLTGQVFLDQCVHHPLMYFPVFYLVKDFVVNDGKIPNVGKVLDGYKETMREDLLALWKIWVPATFLNFAFMPMWARIPWVAGVSALWTCVLSAMRGGTNTDSVAGGAVTSETFKIVEEGFEELFSCPVELDKKLSHICVSASGPDRVGWVAKLSHIISENNGNITHSKMVRLGQEFIVLMHISVEPEGRGQLLRRLRCDELKPLNIRATGLNRRETKDQEKVQAGFRIHLSGEGELLKYHYGRKQSNIFIVDLL